ncbi:MAG TPA: hypothetical protein VG591_05830 [Burkholderiales bacterium]|jgi:hypothetical protein|nr:hypothetical protein [Burkholderiales bacterium]
MRTPLRQQPYLELPRLVTWRRRNRVTRRKLPLRVLLQVLAFGQVYFGSW